MYTNLKSLGGLHINYKKKLIKVFTSSCTGFCLMPKDPKTS